MSVYFSRRLRRISLFCGIALMLIARPAAAFSISSGLSDGCHERITVNSYLPIMALLDSPGLVFPDDAATERIIGYIMELTGLSEDDPVHAYILTSLIVGVRKPDTEGFSGLDLVSQRTVHMADNQQNRHCLRRASHDGEQGNADALGDCRNLITEYIDTALNMAAMPAEEQNIKVTMNMEYYGPVSFHVHGPAYYIGMAAHTLQDSFSHTLRSGDYRTILHVTNYVDALSAAFNEERDGMAHSITLDHCNAEAEPLAEIAGDATREMFMAIAAVAGGSDPDAVDALFARWLQYRPGCSLANNYCNAPWAGVARREQTRPILEDLLGCRSAGELYLFSLITALGVVALRHACAVAAAKRTKGQKS